jgi:hypothetical protein
MRHQDRTKPRRILSRGIRQTNLSGREFAGMLTVGALGLALALGAALPAKADSKDDLAKALLGALFVGVIVNTLDDQPRSAPVVIQPEPVTSRRVPASCAITIDGAQRSVTLYPETCLRREGLQGRLPQGCANTATIFGRKDKVYSTQCLRDAGFRALGS